MAALFALVAGWFGQLFTVSVVRYLASKAVAILIVVVILPIVLNNFLYGLLSMSIDMINSNASGSLMSSMTLSLTGLLGHVAEKLRLPEALSLIMSAAALRATLDFFSFRNLWLMR